MTATGMNLHLRRPDGAQLDAADVAAMAPGTLLVIQLDARLADGAQLIEGVPVTPAAIAAVIGWIPADMRHAGRSLLIGCCRSIHQAAAHAADARDAEARARAAAVTADTDGQQAGGH